MGQEERAALLNNVAPDDRTLLLGELPANMTRQLLTPLSQEERAVAVILLGYPARSIGRLMTPDYLYCGGTDLVNSV
jgi:magnesium transporter